MPQVCAQCRQPLKGHFLQAGGQSFHSNCFLCHSCQKPIRGSFQQHKKGFYHSTCYQQVMGLVCQVCQEVLGAQWLESKGKKYHQPCLQKASEHQCDVCGEGILGSYIIDSWGNKGHDSHSCCSSCGRLISKKTSKGGFAYEDGRFICGFCDKTVVHRSWTINRCKRKILKQLLKVGFKDIPADVPIQLVDQNEFTRRTNSLHVKGLTVTQTQQGTMQHKIYILHGLPQIEFEAILAHELLHVWQNEHGFKISSRHSEGLCNLASYWICQQEKSELALHLMENLKKNPDPIYGQGFRLMLKRWEKLGWKAFVKEILTQKEGVEQSLWRKIFG